MSDQVEVAEKKEIEQEMCCLESLAEELLGQFEGLAGRMDKVTRPTQPSEPVENLKAKLPETGLGQRLRSIFGKLDALLGHMQSIKSRLEL